MFKWLLLILLVIVVFFAVKIYRTYQLVKYASNAIQKIKTVASTVQANLASSENLVTCTYCEIQLPINDALVHTNNNNSQDLVYFCSTEHLQADQQKL